MIESDEDERIAWKSYYKKLLKRTEFAKPRVVSEMVKSKGEAEINKITDLINQILEEKMIPADWKLTTIVNYNKRKGDVLGEQTIWNWNYRSDSENSWEDYSEFDREQVDKNEIYSLISCQEVELLMSFLSWNSYKKNIRIYSLRL